MTINSSERRTILLLLKPELLPNELAELKMLLALQQDWSIILGQLIFHKVAGLAWSNINKLLTKGVTLDFAFPQFRRFLRNIHTTQLSRISEQIDLTNLVCKELDEKGIDYTVLKGIVLSQHVYENLGARDSNDTDILVAPGRLQESMNIIKSKGYIQGDYSSIDGKITPVERKELILRPMVSHEVVPFKKIINGNPFLVSHTIDLHFSIDLMTGNRTDRYVDELLSRKISLKFMDSEITTFSWEDHLLFLCLHFYKEAITDLEVINYKDLSFYKLCDLYHMISSPKINLDWEIFLRITSNFELQKEIYFAFHYILDVFDENIIPLNVLEQLRPANLDYLHTVYRYNSNKIAIKWDDNIPNRIFNTNRAATIIKQNNYTEQ